MEGLDIIEDTSELDGDAILASVLDDDKILNHSFEFKDEVKIKTSSLRKYKDIKDLYDVIKGKKLSKTGRIVDIDKKGIISVDFWSSTPAKNKIHPDDLILVSKASDRINVAAIETPTKEVTQPIKEVNQAIAKPMRYNQGTIEVWDAIIGMGLDFPQGSAVKYIARYKYKDGIQDLHKAVNFLIKIIANETGKNYYDIRGRTIDQITKGEY